MKRARAVNGQFRGGNDNESSVAVGASENADGDGGHDSSEEDTSSSDDATEEDTLFKCYADKWNQAESDHRMLGCTGMRPCLSTHGGDTGVHEWAIQLDGGNYAAVGVAVDDCDIDEAIGCQVRHRSLHSWRAQQSKV
jgi:hypothetical protein